MRILYLLFCLTLSTTLFAQQNFDNQWKKVYQFELNGEIKSAQKEVQSIFKKAKRQENEVQLVKTFFYLSKFKQVLNENAQLTIIKDIEREINEAKPVSKALLRYIYIEMLVEYQSNYRKNVNQRTPIKDQKNHNFLTWTALDFYNEIDSNYTKLLESESDLRAVSVASFKEIFEISSNVDAKNLSIYDFLFEKCSLYFQSKVNPLTINKNSIKIDDIGLFFTEPNIFQQSNFKLINDQNLQRLIKIWKKNEAFHLIQKNDNELDRIFRERVTAAQKLFKNDSLYQKTIYKLEKKTKNVFLKQQLRLDRLTTIYKKAEKYNKTTDYNEALLLIDTILNTRLNVQVMHSTENVKEYILHKYLTIEIPKNSYPNQNNLAFVTYRNIDSLKVKYYNLPVNYLDYSENYRYYDDNSKKRDSLVNIWVTNNQPLKEQFVILDTIKKFTSLTTEFVLEKLDIGNYLVYVETSNYDNQEKAFSYQQITVTDFFIVEDTKEDEDQFYIYNRKNGKPLENIVVKNKSETKISSKNGKVSFKHKKREQNKNYRNKAWFTSKNDTISREYNEGYILDDSTTSSDDYDEWEAQAMVYFDRAIYRPGQKLFYKGILVQQKDLEKSVVPFVTVKVIIKDATYKSIKEYEVQTNEFGSFSGEFEIPKNVVTGEFEIEIEEPENYEQDEKYYDKKEEEHRFWDNVDFRTNSFNFSVEEYKRPTFEITFNDIKENYTIGDTINIKGNAKTFAGNNLTNAKISYSISKSSTIKDKFVPYQENFITQTTSTNENGDFIISFVANDSLFSNKEIKAFHYTIKLAVTDSQGETQTASKSVTVSQEMLDLQLIIPNEIYAEEENKLEIKSQTKNQFPIEASGKILIYEIKSKTFLKQRRSWFPTIQTISREKFESLFPNLPYEKSDIEPTEELVKIISFDTKKSKEITLSFLKNFPNKQFKIVAEALDQKGNIIKTEKRLTVSSKEKPLRADKIFTFKDISAPNSTSYTFEIYSVIPDLYITGRYYELDKMSSEPQTIQLINGKGTLKFEKTKKEVALKQFHFSTIWENEGYEEKHRIDKPNENSQLQFEIVSLRNKIEPGSKEKWAFKIIDQKIQTEILASMYDSSLDQFQKRNWEFFRESSTDYYDLDVSMLNERNTFFYFNNFMIKRNFWSNEINTKWEIDWFGFEFDSERNDYKRKKYENRIKSKSKNSGVIIGNVSDKLGPLAGANVVVKGTKNGTTTDFDGDFSIEAKQGDILEFTYIGLKKTSVTIGNSKVINIILEEDYLSGGEVAVHGYKTKTSMVSSMVVENRPNSNVINTLQGQVAGLDIKSFSGQPGKINEVIIRGIGSVNASTKPLYVIDGVPVTEEHFQKLNSSDLENIAILVDASATAIYGSRGANGVVVVTTKNAIKELAQVQTRSNFNETAFFFPHITTDKDGAFSFEFTAPESLTQWKLRLLGHNKQSDSGYLESNIIAQKEVMLQTNMPRFVREKDEITLTAKVANLTNEVKTGNAMLLLFDANSMNPIDSIAANESNVKSFSCRPKESVAVSWTIKIPENVQGLQYKIVAKSGNYSDGEENILPVLNNKILVTESLPIWVKANSKKEYVFEKLKNAASKSARNHQLTLTYTSNPTWLVLEALPYLMEYEHECAEQTFSRYYGNFMASEIISSQPKMADLLESWKKNPVPTSKLSQNETLKSIVLNETPWLLDSESEASKNKRLALLMDANAMKESKMQTLKKLEEKQLPSGGFPWFDGGEANLYITQHILAGFGHLEKIAPEKSVVFENITSKAIPFLDTTFESQKTLKERTGNYNKFNNLHFLYARSFYLDKTPLSPKIKTLIQEEIQDLQSNWLSLTLYQKGLLALTMHRMNEKKFAKKIIKHLKETAVTNSDFGMYWIANKNGYYWYESAIETQALLIEAFSEIENDEKLVEEMKVWLLKQKQLNHWPTTKATTEATYALLLRGKNWNNEKGETQFKIGNQKFSTSEKTENNNLGNTKKQWSANEISENMGQISVNNQSKVPGFGGVYWQYFEDLETINSDENQKIKIEKTLFKKESITNGNQLVAITNSNIKVGDLITIRLVVTTNENLEFVHLKDARATCFEPVAVLSKYEWQNNIGYYRSTKDVATHFFFDTMNKGTYVFEYDVRVTNLGIFNDGIATLQSMYAPEFSAFSKSTKVQVQE
jgi:TonB-dependent SusC/RagA subfamily outer membrane receptor